MLYDQRSLVLNSLSHGRSARKSFKRYVWLSLKLYWDGCQGFQLNIVSLQWRHNGVIATQITGLTIVYSIVYSNTDQRKHQSAASLAFMRGMHRGPVNSPHKWPLMRKRFPFDDVIMSSNGLVPSGNKPVSEPLLNNIYVAIWHH